MLDPIAFSKITGAGCCKQKEKRTCANGESQILKMSTWARHRKLLRKTNTLKEKPQRQQTGKHARQNEQERILNEVY